MTGQGGCLWEDVRTERSILSDPVCCRLPIYPAFLASLLQPYNVLGSELPCHLLRASKIQESDGDIATPFSEQRLSTKSSLDTITLQLADKKRVAEKGSHTFFAS